LDGVVFDDGIAAAGDIDVVATCVLGHGELR
jgi:hypothetical protein